METRFYDYLDYFHGICQVFFSDHTRVGLTHAALLSHKLPSLWQEIAVFSGDSHLTEQAAVKIA